MSRDELQTAGDKFAPAAAGDELHTAVDLFHCSALGAYAYVVECRRGGGVKWRFGVDAVWQPSGEQNS